MRLLLCCVLLFSGLYTRAVAADSAAPIQVAAAADLQPVLPAVLAEFRKQSGHTVNVSYGSSATLTTQIESGAPFDLFLSADMGFPQRLIGDRLATGSAPVAYARGTLVLWTRNDSPVHTPSMDVLKDGSVASVAIANPEHAPYGRAAVAALRGLGAYERLQPKLRVAENIAQAAQFAESGNATVGLLSLTSARSARLQAEGHFVEVPAQLYPPILQGAVVLTHAHDRDGAKALLDYLLSPVAQKELTARGLKPPQ